MLHNPHRSYLAKRVCSAILPAVVWVWVQGCPVWSNCQCAMDAKKWMSTMHSDAKAKAMAQSSPQHNAEQIPSIKRLYKTCRGPTVSNLQETWFINWVLFPNDCTITVHWWWKTSVMAMPRHTGGPLDNGRRHNACGLSEFSSVLQLRRSGASKWPGQGKRPNIRDHLQDWMTQSHTSSWHHLLLHICCPVECWCPSQLQPGWRRRFESQGLTWTWESGGLCRSKWHLHTIQSCLAGKMTSRSFLQLLGWSRGRVSSLQVPRQLVQRV